MFDFHADVEKHLNYKLTNHQSEQLKIYYDFLIEYNKITNLTRITQENDVYYKHFFDSFLVNKTIDLMQVHSLCDIGSGAGFPGIPLKILFTHLDITIIDSSQKRIYFLEQLTKMLSLQHVKLFHDRIENFALKNKNKFDVITARALGPLNLILEMSVPMLKTGGHLVAMKSTHFENDIKISENALKVLKTKLTGVHKFELPYDFGFRANLLLKKDQHVDGFPRPYQSMLKKPL